MATRLLLVLCAALFASGADANSALERELNDVVANFFEEEADVELVADKNSDDDDFVSRLLSVSDANTNSTTTSTTTSTMTTTSTKSSTATTTSTMTTTSTKSSTATTTSTMTTTITEATTEDVDFTDETTNTTTTTITTTVSATTTTTAPTTTAPTEEPPAPVEQRRVTVAINLGFNTPAQAQAFCNDGTAKDAVKTAMEAKVNNPNAAVNVVFQIDGASCETGGSRRLQGRRLAANQVDAVFSITYPDAASATTGSDTLTAVAATEWTDSITTALNNANRSDFATSVSVTAVVTAPVTTTVTIAATTTPAVTITATTTITRGPPRDSGAKRGSTAAAAPVLVSAGACLLASMQWL